MSPQTGSTPPTAGQLRVLVVDDQKDTARMLKLFIGSAGHEVHTAESKAAALEATARRTFDVLVSDVRLPDGSGYDLMAELRTRNPIKGIIFSGLSGAEEEARSRAAGFSAFLVKPLDLERLLETIAQVVSE